MMFIALAVSLAAAAPNSAATQNRSGAQRDPAPIVVTGERISDLEANLAACLARKCPPNEDVDASLALAEGEFLNGDYDRAERAIHASVGRNRRHRRAYPEPVADLFRSQARVQSHRGRDEQSAQSTYEILRTLRAGIPQEDHRHFTARLEIVRAEVKRGNRHGVLRELGELITQARKAGRQDVVRRAEFRRLIMSAMITPYGEPIRRLHDYAKSTDPNQVFERVSARFYLAQDYRERGDIARSDAMLAGIPKSDTDTRTLLYSPRIKLLKAEAYSSDWHQDMFLPAGGIDSYYKAWIDVAYWIRADGSVENVEVVRRGASADWADPVLDSIRERRYSASADPTPSYRLERYTYTAMRGVTTGSRLVNHVGIPRVEFLDLTAPTEPGRPVPERGIAPSPASRNRGVSN